MTDEQTDDLQGFPVLEEEPFEAIYRHRIVGYGLTRDGKWEWFEL